MKVIIANWKSHKSWAEAQTWLEEFAEKSALTSKDLTVVLAPPMPLVAAVAEWMKWKKFEGLQLGVQDLSPFPPGSYTGATSIQNLEGLPVKWAILGHSERRRYFHETHQQVANKVEQAVTAGITPVVCVDKEDITSQFVAIEPQFLSKCLVAYEPAAAIGSGNEEPVAEVTNVIEKMQQTGKPRAFMYGGSVSAGTVAKYLEVTSGVIVATHSLDVDDFINLLQAAD